MPSFPVSMEFIVPCLKRRIEQLLVLVWVVMALSERFWKAVYEFSQGLSQTTELMVGKEVDYFTTLKARLDTYVAALEGAAETEAGPVPAELIGPVFADLCGDRDDLFAFMAGSKMFKNTIVRVKAYLTALNWR